MAIWRIHNNQDYNIPFTSIDSKAKLGKVCDTTTFPILVSEVGSLSNEKYGDNSLVEMMKNIVELPIARAAHDRKGRYRTFAARSPFVLTGNPPPPIEGGYLSRILDIIFTTKDQHVRGSKQALEFQAWLASELDKMGVLGDFTYFYIREHPEILKKSWSDAGVEILNKFYKEAGIEIPEWINLMVETKPLQDATDRTMLLIREYFINLINFNYSRLGNRDDSLNIIGKLNHCCDNILIAFIQHDRVKKKYYITKNIMDDLKAKKLDSLVGSLEGLADMLGFKCQSNRVMGKTMYSISVEEGLMNKFLMSNIEEEEEFTQSTFSDSQDNHSESSLEQVEKIRDPYLEEFEAELEREHNGSVVL
jgi:hypothetical protein